MAEKMTGRQDPVQEFLAGIGPRELTPEEARTLKRLRLAQGKDAGITGVIDALEDERAQETVKK